MLVYLGRSHLDVCRKRGGRLGDQRESTRGARSRAEKVVAGTTVAEDAGLAANDFHHGLLVQRREFDRMPDDRLVAVIVGSGVLSRFFR